MASFLSPPRLLNVPAKSLMILRCSSTALPSSKRKPEIFPKLYIANKQTSNHTEMTNFLKRKLVIIVGIRPAIDAVLPHHTVGGSAQIKATWKVAGTLRLILVYIANLKPLQLVQIWCCDRCLNLKPFVKIIEAFGNKRLLQTTLCWETSWKTHNAGIIMALDSVPWIKSGLVYLHDHFDSHHEDFWNYSKQLAIFPRGICTLIAIQVADQLGNTRRRGDGIWR